MNICGFFVFTRIIARAIIIMTSIFSDERGAIMGFAYISIILNSIKFLLEMAASILIIMCAVKYLRKQWMYPSLIRKQGQTVIFGV